jgi:hypothetical protein
MTTYREAIYMCNDLLKGMSDDFTYTEEHIAYLLDKFRALLLKQRYGSDPKKHVPYSNYQTLEVTFDDFHKNKSYYTSTTTIPYMLQLGIPRVISEGVYYDYTFDFTSRERLPFVGHNKYLKKIWYCAINEENKLCLKPSSTKVIVSGNTSLTIKLTGIFENPREVTDEISFGESSTGDELDRNIPIEEGLITTLIEMVVKELAGSVYRPNDEINDNRDDNADMASFIRSNMKSNIAKQLA